MAVYHVVNYIQTRKRHMHTPNGDKKRKFIRRTHHQNDSQSDSEVYDSDIEEDGDHAYRVPVKSYQASRSQKTNRHLKTARRPEKSRNRLGLATQVIQPTQIHVPEYEA